MAASVELLRSIILRHVSLHFADDAYVAVQRRLHVVEDASFTLDLGGHGDLARLYVFAEERIDVEPEVNRIWVGADLTISSVGFQPRPEDGWEALGDGPIWWRSPRGSLTPAWDVGGLILDQLACGEESRNHNVDSLSRHDYEAGHRYRSGLMAEPTVNDYIAALVAGCLALESGTDPREMIGVGVLPPLVFLSHDCDNITGRSFWLNASRLFRARSSRAQARRSLGAIRAGVVTPDRYFFDDIAGYARLENHYGFSSRFYVLNGKRGRIDSRASQVRTERAVHEIRRTGNEVGVHYSLESFDSPEKLCQQIEELERWSGADVMAGRAHYLRYDAESSPPMWADCGIRLDESFGLSKHIGFRTGLAGPYRIFDRATYRELPVVEVPLTIMDRCLFNHGVDPFEAFQAQFDRISQVGGSISILFHTGLLDTPEMPQYRGLYDAILSYMHAKRARQLSTATLLAHFDTR